MNLKNAIGTTKYTNDTKKGATSHYRHARSQNRSAGILPAYDVKSPALAKSKKRTHRNPNPPSRPQAGAPTSLSVSAPLPPLGPQTEARILTHCVLTLKLTCHCHKY
jgi:hypothetical protein